MRDSAVALAHCVGEIASRPVSEQRENMRAQQFRRRRVVSERGVGKI